MQNKLSVSPGCPSMQCKSPGAGAPLPLAGGGGLPSRRQLHLWLLSGSADFALPTAHWRTISAWYLHGCRIRARCSLVASITINSASSNMAWSISRRFCSISATTCGVLLFAIELCSTRIESIQRQDASRIRAHLAIQNSRINCSYSARDIGGVLAPRSPRDWAARSPPGEDDGEPARLRRWRGDAMTLVGEGRGAGDRLHKKRQ